MLDVIVTIQDARGRAMQILASINRRQKELPTVPLPDELRVELEAACDLILGSEYDVMDEVFNLAELLETGGDINLRNKKMGQVVSSLRELIAQLQTLTNTVGDLWHQDPPLPASLL